MKRGLIIGKFLPLHEGHIALIKFAAAQCDQLIVSMSFTATDPIEPFLRFSWLNESFKDLFRIKTEMVLDDFDDSSLAMTERIIIWASFIKKRFPGIDLIFSSETYGESLGAALGVPHVAFDLPRQRFPVSASMIRSAPFQNWEFIPPVVRPYFVKKVCFFGPESTGKTTMAKRFAGLYKTDYVPEVSREIVTTNSFSVEDIIKIGIAQTDRIMSKLKTANKVLLCDTDLITTQIYSDQYLHQIPPVLVELEKLIVFDHYFLFDIDVAWVPDGLRDLGAKREEMFEVFRSALEKRKLKYSIVRGNWEQRAALIQIGLDNLL